MIVKSAPKINVCLPMTNLRKFITKRIHIQSIQKTCKTLTETSKTTMHFLQLFKIGIQVSKRVREFCKGRFERVKREWVIGLPVFTEGSTRHASKRGGWTVTTSGWVGLTVCGGCWTMSVWPVLLVVWWGCCRRHH